MGGISSPTFFIMKQIDEGFFIDVHVHISRMVVETVGESWRMVAVGFESLLYVDCTSIKSLSSGLIMLRNKLITRATLRD